MSTLYIKYPAALAGPGTGDVIGPGSSTDNAVARFDGTTGKLLQNSVVTIGDTGVVAGSSIDAATNTLTNIANASISASAAIGGTKISPNFGSQAVTTTGIITGASLVPSSSTVATNGLYLSAANQPSISSNSTERMAFSSAGNIGVAGATNVNSLMNFGGTNPMTQATENAIRIELTGSASAVNLIAGINCSGFGTSANAFTCGVVASYLSNAIAKGAGSTITRAIGFYGKPQTAGTNNAVLSDNESFTGSYFINQVGTDTSVFGGPVQFANGTVGAPSIAFTSDADGTGTGFYRSSANTVSLALNGVQSASWTSTVSFIQTNDIRLGDNTSAASISLGCGSSFSNGVLAVCGDPSSASGASIKLFGSTHASVPSVTRFDNAGNTAGSINASALWSFGSGTANSSSILTIGTATHSLAGATQRGALCNMVFTSAATGQAHAYQASPQTAAAAFTAPVVTGFYAASMTKGAGSAITRAAAFVGNIPTVGTNNAVFTDDDSFAWTGNFGLYLTTTNPSFLSGAIATKRGDVSSTATITAMASSTSFVRITGSTITAIQGITAGIDGQRLVVFNNAGVAVTFANENAGATAANRITTMTGADVATTGNGAAELIYDTGTSRWILLYVTA